MKEVRMCIFSECRGGTTWVWKTPAEMELETNFSSYKALAEGGDAAAQLKLASYYGTNIYNKFDAREAQKWYRKAAEQGVVTAQMVMGTYYDPDLKSTTIHGARTDDGINKSYQEALKWYTQAAQQGHSEAQQRLGFYYFAGRGVSKNDEEAFFWYALGGHAELARQIARDDLSPEQLANLNKRMVDWKAKPTVATLSMTLPPKFQEMQKKAEGGDVESQVALAKAYSHGNEGVLRNNSESVKWHRAAAEQGDISAQLALGGMYSEQRNFAEALKWLHPAAENGSPTAQIQLSRIYSGEYAAVDTGIPANFEEAYFWGVLSASWKIASDMHNRTLQQLSAEKISQLQQRVANWKPKSKSILLDKKRADEIERLRAQANDGKIEAQEKIGEQYLYNSETRSFIDFAEAETWLRKASASGRLKAAYKLGLLLEARARIPEAVDIWLKAAAQGEDYSMQPLQEYYRTLKDYETAYFWLCLAIEKNPQMKANRSNAIEKLTAEQVAATEKKAAEWITIHWE